MKIHGIGNGLVNKFVTSIQVHGFSVTLGSPDMIKTIILVWKIKIRGRCGVLRKVFESCYAGKTDNISSGTSRYFIGNVGYYHQGF